MLALLRGRRIRRVALSAVIVIGSLSSLLLFAQPASVAHASAAHGFGAPANATSGAMETHMVVTGFDAAVAKAHGYHIVTVNGVEASVKDGTTTPTPYDYLKGNCGDSWLFMDGGTLEFTYTTGFQNLALPADWFGWEVVIVGPNGYNPDWTWGGPMFGTGWSTGNVQVHVGSAGWYDGLVVPGGSWVILIDGSVCYSEGPMSGTQVAG